MIFRKIIGCSYYPTSTIVLSIIIKNKLKVAAPSSVCASFWIKLIAEYSFLHVFNRLMQLPSIKDKQTAANFSQINWLFNTYSKRPIDLESV